MYVLTSSCTILWGGRGIVNTMLYYFLFVSLNALSILSRVGDGQSEIPRERTHHTPQATQGWSEQAYGGAYTQVSKILWERLLRAMECLLVSETNISLISTTDQDEERVTRTRLCSFLAASRTMRAPGKSLFLAISFLLS
jgi:hypothetical protein